MSVNYRLLVFALLAFPLGAFTQSLEFGLGGSYFILPEPEPGHYSAGADPNYGWELDIRYNSSAKNTCLKCFIFQAYHLKTSFNTYSWAGGGALSTSVKGEMNTYNVGFGWIPLKIPIKKIDLEWRFGFALNLLVFDNTNGHVVEFNAHNFTPPKTTEKDFTRGRREGLSEVITFNLLTSIDIGIVHRPKLDWKLRVKSAINPFSEFAHLSCFRNSIQLVASFPLSRSIIDQK